MSLFTWNSNYSVKIQHLDEQHQKMLTLINQLNDLLKTSQGKENLSQILDDLVDYAAIHFKAEEVLFEKYQYPDQEKHIKEHQKFFKQIMDFRKDFRTGKLLLSLEVLNFLKDWLIQHILASDKEYSDFLNEKGVH